MVKSALHTRTIFSTDARAPENCPSTITPDSSFQSEEALPGGSAPAIDSFDIGSFDLVRKFVEHVVAKNASTVLGNGRSSRNAVDWDAVQASVADSRSFEQAIGRAVVIADQMCRGVFDVTQAGDAPSSLEDEDPFFAFSMADVVPDFGDECRYRTRVARKVARIFGTRLTVVALVVSLMLVLSSVTMYQVTQQGPSELASYRTPDDRALTGNAQLMKGSSSPAVAVSLPASTAPPATAPPSLAGAPPLRPHEVFGSHRIGRSIKVPDST